MKRPLTLVILVSILIPHALGCCLCRPKSPPDKYAVLASTRMATNDDVEINGDFWHDLVLAYCTLVESGFEEENIFVLYGDGKDFASELPLYAKPYCNGTVDSKITDIPLKIPTDRYKANLCNVLCCLSTGRPAKLPGGDCACRASFQGGSSGFSCSDHSIPRLGNKDFLITWVKGHGSSENCATKMTFAKGPYITDHEMAGLLKKLRPDRQVMLFETCDAGGWLDNFGSQKNAMVVVTSGSRHGDADCVEISHAAAYDEVNPDGSVSKAVVHGRFTYWITAALRQADLMGVLVSSDLDQNNLVSVQEDFASAKGKIVGENSMPTAEYGGDMYPAIKPGGVAPCIFIRLPAPGNDHDVFAMDHPDDDGTIPSDVYGGASDKRDLWVRQSAGGPAEHQSPRTNSINHVYARVRNIGCADPGSVTVKFYWASSIDPSTWHYIDQDIVNSLPVGESRLAHALWEIQNVPDPAGGPYWLIATLSAAKDVPTADKVIANDNNKVRIMTQVVPP